MDGLKTVVDIYAEQSNLKGRSPIRKSIRSELSAPGVKGVGPEKNGGAEIASAAVSVYLTINLSQS